MELSKNKQVRSKDNEPKLGARLVEINYDGISRIIEFNIFTVEFDRRKRRVFGSGAFEERDLEHVAAELTQLARDFALCEAEAEAEMQALEDAEQEEAEHE